MTRLDTDAGWAKYNRHYWLRAYEDFISFFRRAVPARARTRRSRFEDFISWALATDPADARGTRSIGLMIGGTEGWIALLPCVVCPTLVLHGDRGTGCGPGTAQGAALA